MHNKFLLIGDQRGGEVAQFTSNFVDNQMLKYQDLLVIPDDELYQFYDAYFDRMLEGEWLGWSTNDTRSTVGGSYSIQGHVFPRVGPEDDEDGYYEPDVYPMVEALADADCSSGGTVRVAHGQIRVSEVYQQLETLKEDGCDVRVIVDKDHKSWVSDYDLNARYGPTHSKFILVDTPRQEIVHTGSHNPRPKAVRESNDTMVSMSHPHVYEEYKTYFDDQWDQVKPV